MIGIKNSNTQEMISMPILGHFSAKITVQGDNLKKIKKMLFS
jgi:hypothetical protein